MIPRLWHIFRVELDRFTRFSWRFVEPSGSVEARYPSPSRGS